MIYLLDALRLYEIPGDAIETMFLVIKTAPILPLLFSTIFLLRYREVKLLKKYILGALILIPESLFLSLCTPIANQPIILSVVIAIIDTVYFYLIFKLSNETSCWKNNIALGLGKSTSFIVYFYSLGTWTFYETKRISESIHYAIPPDPPIPVQTLTNSSLIHNVPVTTSADYLPLIFEIPFTLIIITAIAALIGTFLYQQKKVLGFIVGVISIATIFISVVLLEEHGYILYSVFAVAGLISIFLTNRLSIQIEHSDI